MTSKSLIEKLQALIGSHTYSNEYGVFIDDVHVEEIIALVRKQAAAQGNVVERVAKAISGRMSPKHADYEAARRAIIAMGDASARKDEDAGQPALMPSPATGQPVEQPQPLEAVKAWGKWWKENKPLLEQPNGGDGATGFYAGWDAALATKRESGVHPIATAPLHEHIIALWIEETQGGVKFADDAQVIRLLVSKKDWRSGDKAWLNQGSGNYGTPKQQYQWPTHWMKVPALTEIEGGEGGK